MNDKKELIKNLIDKGITHFREDTFVNHVKSWWNGDGELSGLVSENGFKIWSCSRRQSGIMHIVVQGVFIENNESLKVLLKPKINIAGKIFLASFLAFWAFGCWHIDFESIIIRCLLFLIFPAVFVLGYNSERKIILEAVEKIIESH